MIPAEENVDAEMPEIPLHDVDMPLDDDVNVPVNSGNTTDMAVQEVIPNIVIAEELQEDLPPMPPPATTKVPKARKRRQSVDNNTKLSSEVLFNRNLNPNIDCKPRKADVLTKSQMMKLREKDLLSVPATNVLCMQQLFTNVRVQPQDVDYSILESVFGQEKKDTNINGEDANKTLLDVLRGAETVRRTSSRLSDKKSAGNRIQSQPSSPIVQPQPELLDEGDHDFGNNFDDDGAMANIPIIDGTADEPNASVQQDKDADNNVFSAPPPPFPNENVQPDDAARVYFINTQDVENFDFILNNDSIASKIPEGSVERDLLTKMLTLWGKNITVNLIHLHAPDIKRIKAAIMFAKIMGKFHFSLILRKNH